MRRAQVNSHNRLFGTPERPYLPVKSTLMSGNILGGSNSDNSTKIMNGNGIKYHNSSASNGQTNDHTNGLNEHTNVDKGN